MVKTFPYQLLKNIRTQLLPQFNEEAEPLAFMIVEHFSGLAKTDILIDKPFNSGPQFDSKIQTVINRLNVAEPIQYILGRAYFYDRPFLVNKHTLIPRQETEELVYLVLNELDNNRNLNIIDIGTGSGCIPITLSLEAKQHGYEGIDISKQALDTAQINASNLGAQVKFTVVDILEENLGKNYDVIISNPPYVLDSEKALMKQNVLKYEPHHALFVLDKNPLLFYNRITELATKSLNPKGKLYFEINEQFGKEVVELLEINSFLEVKLRQDLNGKDRFVSGVIG